MCWITCPMPASQPFPPSPVSTANRQQARMAAASADTEASGRRHKLRRLQINTLTLWQLMLANSQWERCGRGLLPNALVSADGDMISTLALLACLVCFGIKISKFKQRHIAEPGGHCSGKSMHFQFIEGLGSFTCIIPTKGSKRSSAHNCSYTGHKHGAKRFLLWNFGTPSWHKSVGVCFLLASICLFFLTDLGNLSTAFSKLFFFTSTWTLPTISTDRIWTSEGN